ncbi:MAG: 5-methyltetrahydropteroyltriglutamate--homocysteine methyltransferase, partial [Wujia sp.]
MSNIKTPFRYDFVGSFLRPQRLKDAKIQYQNGNLGKEAFDRIVNEEITKVVDKQKELGFHVITDGEFRRTYWHLDFMWGFEGVAHEQTGGG